MLDIQLDVNEFVFRKQHSDRGVEAAVGDQELERDSERYVCLFTRLQSHGYAELQGTKRNIFIWGGEVARAQLKMRISSCGRREALGLGAGERA